MSGPEPHARDDLLLGTGLAGRLLVVLTAVLAGAGLTALLVAGAVGPPIFHQHLVHTEAGADEAVVLHAEQAFAGAGRIALLLALVAGTAVGLVLSVLLARRVGASLRRLSAAAQLVAGGQYGARVPEPRMGPEFDEVVHAFNDMAARLEGAETRRRRLLADVAHELRTPVATLEAHLDAIEDGVADLSPATLEALRAQSARLTRLTEDLAQVTQAESGATPLELRAWPVADLLEAAVDAVRPQADRVGVELAVAVRAGTPAVLVDRGRLAQVLANLLDNALRHTPAGGSVTLTAGPGSRTQGVELVVADTGDGVAEEDLPHLFERFYRAGTARDRSTGGSGIGLAIVRALVLAHGGAVRVESDGPGRGTRVVVHLPAAGAPSSGSSSSGSSVA